MPDFSVLATNHTGITVSNLDRAVAFYSNVLGFTLRDRGPRDPAFIEQVVAVPGADVEIAYMTAPGHTLELIEYRGPAGRGRYGRARRIPGRRISPSMSMRSRRW